MRTEAKNPQGAQLTAQFGYAIESLATHLLSTSVEGWRLSAQVAEAGTRPDLVATKGNSTVWIDLTATGSAGHIYFSKNWHNRSVCPYPHAEVTYPSMDAGVGKVILANALKEINQQPNPTDIDADALRAQAQRAQREAEANMARWRRAHVPSLKREVSPVSAFDHEKGNPTDAGRLSRNELFAWLNATFKPDQVFKKEPDAARKRRRPRQHGNNSSPYARPRISYSSQPAETDEEFDARMAVENQQRDEDDRQRRRAASILMALGVSPTAYGLESVTGSAASGVIFLERYDPSVAAQTQPVAATGPAVPVPDLMEI